MTKKISVIIDFDDTLVESNTARDVLLEFVPSEYEEIANLYKSKKINFKTYQELSFEKAFSIANTEKIANSSIKNSKIRIGFKDLVLYCERNEIDIFILSSGLNMYIEPVLKEFKNNIKIIAADVIFDKNNNCIFEYQKSYDDMCSPDWGICKCKTVDSLKENNFLIYIGDGITTDLCASKKCDQIFALNPLYNGLLEKKIIVDKFVDFNQIEKYLSALQRKID